MINRETDDIKRDVILKVIKHLRSRPRGYPLFDLSRTLERVGRSWYGDIIGYLLCDKYGGPNNIPDNIDVPAVVMRHAGLSAALYDALIEPALFDHMGIDISLVTGENAAFVLEHLIKPHGRVDWTPVANDLLEDEETSEYNPEEKVASWLTVHGKP